MSGNKSDNNFKQISMFDVLKIANAVETDSSSEELKTAIADLQKLLSCVKSRYKDKKETEKREREESERKALEEAERKAREEELRKIHVQEVTCMDLPLSWDNVFNSDVRAQGKHTDSIPDALIISLTKLKGLTPCQARNQSLYSF